jgi:Flp pilus assembly protein TadG
VSRGREEEGVVIVWVALMLVILVGITGLAMDAGQMYVVKQKAQAAADAAVTAGVIDMYNGTTAGGGVYGTKTVCSTSSGWTPCYYARKNGFGGTASDTVTVDFSYSGSTSQTCKVPSGLGGALATDNPSVICVTASRVVNTTLMRVLGQNSSTVSALAIAAIVLGPAPLPIVVTHRHLVDAFSETGGTAVTITGGPTRAFQVDSDGTVDQNGHNANTPEAFSINNNSSIDLSKAGPNSTGADFRSWGPAYSQDTTASISYGSSSCTSWLCLGSTGNYIDPGSIISDPFAQLAEPSKPANPGTVTNVNTGQPLVPGCSAVCPATSIGGCQVYTQGLYTGGIQVKGNNLVTAYFAPGLYYIVDDTKKQNNVGFQGASGSDMEMLSSVCTVANDPSTDAGMVVFNAGSSVFSVGSNGNANLVGPAFNNTTYEGILFWADRNFNPCASGTCAVISNAFGGGGNLTLQGTIYANMPNGNTTYNNYQSVLLTGHSGSTTQITGEVITNVLTLKGGTAINMHLSTQQVQNARQIALVQ